jgi:magnesium chelatase accessory protein
MCIGILSLMTVNCNRHFSGQSPRPDRAGADKALPRDWPHREASAFFTSGNLRWHLQHFGSTRPSDKTLILLHGTGGATISWTDLIPKMTGSGCVLALDLPGHGFTTGASVDELTLPTMARQIHQLFLDLNLEGDVNLVGHSAGAPLAIEWALQHQNDPKIRFKLRNLIGLNPSLVPPPQIYTTLLGPIVAPIATSSPMTGMLAFIASNTGMIDQLLDSTGSAVRPEQRKHYRHLFTQSNHIQGAMGFMAGADLPSILNRGPKIQTPIHFLIGAQDPWVKIAPLKEAIAKGFPQAKSTTLTGGHILHEEQPEKVAAYLTDIVRTA